MRPGKTAVRRKTMTSHVLIAEATKLVADAMTSEMRHMSDSNRTMENTKIEVQLKFFLEQM